MVFRLIRRHRRRHVRVRGINGMHIVSPNASPKSQFFYAARLIDCTPYLPPTNPYPRVRAHTPFDDRAAKRKTGQSIDCSLLGYIT